MTLFTEKNTRQLVADEAARLIYDEGYRDYQRAKLKAAERLGASSKAKHQPSNEEIEQALIDYIGLFVDTEQQQILQQHRQIALEAMAFLQIFKPELSGAALTGTSGPHSAITLNLRANSTEEVIFFLEDQTIPFQTHERKMRIGNHQEYIPLLRFYVDDIEVELLVFPDESGYNAPISPITGKRLLTADKEKLQQLIAADELETRDAFL